KSWERSIRAPSVVPAIRPPSTAPTTPTIVAKSGLFIGGGRQDGAASHEATSYHRTPPSSMQRSERFLCTFIETHATRVLVRRKVERANRYFLGHLVDTARFQPRNCCVFRGRRVEVCWLLATLRGDQRANGLGSFAMLRPRRHVQRQSARLA